MNDMMEEPQFNIEDILFTLLDFIIIIVCFILMPFIRFILGWVLGHCISALFGAAFCTGLSMLHITVYQDQIPIFCGTLAVIAGFFRKGLGFPRLYLYSDEDE
jgi:hypothetical protein